MFGKRSLVISSLLLLAFIGCMSVSAYLGGVVGKYNSEKSFHDQLHANKAEYSEAKFKIDAEVEALTQQVVSLKARLIKLDALSEKVARAAKLDNGEFDFSRLPVGGPEIGVDTVDAKKDDKSSAEKNILSSDSVNLYNLLEEFDYLLSDREYQMSMLDRQMLAKQVRSEGLVTGRPVKKGWMSSAFGMRKDPFTKKDAWHNGVDFASKDGGEVIAVGGGVVTASEKRYGYGNMVEISHGGGIVTRYGHNKRNLVEVGDAVKKGQAVALIGSTGRSTGPHVHFEVLKNGKHINPERYIYRSSL